MPFSVSPFFTNWLKKPIAPHFVTFHWPTTPYNASMKFFSAEVVHDWPGLFMSHLVLKKITFRFQPQDGGPLKSANFSRFGYLFGAFIGTCQTNFWSPTKWYRSETCTHTHEAYSSTTWLFRWQKSIICLPTRGGGPDKGPSHGHLGIINPKINSIKQPSRQVF